MLGYNRPFATARPPFPNPVGAPDVDPDDGEIITACFSAAWLPVVLGSLSPLTLQATWKGTPTDILLAQQRAHLLIDMIAQHEGCETMLLRQNPDDACQLEFSIDGGDSWSLAFDYGLCVPPSIATLLEAAALTQGAQPVPPTAPDNSWVYNTGDSEEDAAARVQALCFACSQIVSVILDAYVQAKLGELTPATAAAAAVGFIIALVPFMPALAPFAAALAVIAALLWVYSNFTTVITESIANDPDIRAAMSCQMYQYLSGRTVSPESFAASFDDFTCGTSDENHVADLCAAVLHAPGGDDIYTQFLVLLGGLTVSARGGADFGECDDCAGATWCHDWTGDEIPAEWDIVTGFFDGTNVQIAAPTGGGNWGVDIKAKGAMYMPAGTVCTYVALHYERFGGTNQLYQVRDGNGGDTTPLGFPSSGTFFALTGITDEAVALAPEFNIYTNGVSYDGYIDRLRMSGTGKSPFGACDDC